MAKIIFTQERRLADKILRNLPKQKVIAEQLGITQQMVSYNKKNVYPTELVQFIKLLDLAGYEVREK